MLSKLKFSAMLFDFPCYSMAAQKSEYNEMRVQDIKVSDI